MKHFSYNVSLYCHDGIGNFIPYISLSQFKLLCGGDFIGLSYYQSLLLLLLFLAALADLKTDRIPNGFIVFGIIIGISGSLWLDSDIRQTAVSMLLAFLLLYPLFKIGALGAGDVKVFMMIGSFVEVKELLMILIFSFVIGALCSLLKLLSEHNGRERMQYFLSYISEVVRTRQWKIYGEHTVQDYERYRRNKIHFSIPILFSVALQIGGVI